MKVFVQNEAGSNVKNYHDEKTLEWRRRVEVSRSYPYPYGFVVGTTGEDGYNVDCFVLTSDALSTGDVVECEAIGLMEQVEDGETDHNVLAVPGGQAFRVTREVREQLTVFVEHVFEHIPGKQIRAGRFLGSDAADAYIAQRRDHV